MLCAARRAIRGMAAVACVYGMGFGDRACIQSRERRCPHARRGKLALVFPGERGTPFNGAGRKRSQRSTPHPVFRHSVHPLRYCMGLHGIARPMTLCRGRSHGPGAKSLATDVNDRKLYFMLQSKKSARSAGIRAHDHQRYRTACCSEGCLMDLDSA